MSQIVCPACRLVQFVPAKGRCRRCGVAIYELVEVSLTDFSGSGTLPLGMAVRKIRTKQHRNQDSVAAAAGLARTHLSRVETGESTPHLGTIAKILRALGVDAVILRVKSPMARGA